MKKITLIILSLTLLTLGACGNSKETNNKKNDEVNSAITAAKISTADFYADSKDDGWILAITFEGKIAFVDTKNNIQFLADKNELIVAQGADVVNVSAKNETHIIRVNIDIADCNEKGKQVNIMIRKIDDKNGVDYVGCGVYRGTPQLHDIWAIQKLNGKAVTAEQFPKELPHFEFNLTTQKMSGFAGCNQVNGNLKFEYNRMIVEPLSSTRMYCGETSTIENDILNILRSKPIYSLDGLLLTIESTKGSILLKKVD